MIRFLLIFFITNILFRTIAKSQSVAEPALLIVSYDAFQPEYLYRNVTPNLNKFRREGTSAEFMIPVFPTKTFVNHFTIATVSKVG